jgi:hypothetical protein
MTQSDHSAATCGRSALSMAAAPHRRCQPEARGSGADGGPEAGEFVRASQVHEVDRVEGRTWVGGGEPWADVGLRRSGVLRCEQSGRAVHDPHDRERDGNAETRDGHAIFIVGGERKDSQLGGSAAHVPAHDLGHLRVDRDLVGSAEGWKPAVGDPQQLGCAERPGVVGLVEGRRTGVEPLIELSVCKNALEVDPGFARHRADLRQLLDGVEVAVSSSDAVERLVSGNVGVGGAAVGEHSRKSGGGSSSSRSGSDRPAGERARDHDQQQPLSPPGSYHDSKCPRHPPHSVIVSVRSSPGEGGDQRASGVPAP